MKKIAALLIFLLLLFIPASANADLFDDLVRLQRQIEETRAKIKDLQAQENTLKNQIAYTDYQVELALLEIEELQSKIDILSGDIENLEKRLENLSEALAFQEETLSLRTRESYKTREVTFLDIIFNVSSLEDLFKRIKYLQVLEESDRQLFAKLKEVKAGFSEQKAFLEGKRNEVEDLKAQEEEKKRNLEAYRANRAYVLGVTQNQEENFKKLLQQLEAEQREILRAIERLGVKLGEVSGGKETIAFEGNTGCVLPQPSSSCPTCGSHLHFGIALVNPSTSKLVRYEDPLKYLPGTGSGKLMGLWPMFWPEGGPANVTSGFGWRCLGTWCSFHNAIDIAVGYGNPIRSTSDGTAYFSGDSGQIYSWCNGAAAARIVVHGIWNGLEVRTFYWHVLR